MGSKAFDANEAVTQGVWNGMLDVFDCLAGKASQLACTR